jgi:ribosomal protein S18 acetylase RimI-like enzyme/predicted kinase
MKRKGKLIFLCGKMAAGKSTLSKELSEREHAVLLELDEFLARLYPGQIVDIASFVTYSTRIRGALTPLICSLLSMGKSVVLDFPGNTRKQRSWFRELLQQAGADHELHFIDAPDEACKRQLRKRSRDLPPGTKWTSDADFDALTAYFEPPAADEDFNVVHHQRAWHPPAAGSGHRDSDAASSCDRGAQQEVATESAGLASCNEQMRMDVRLATPADTPDLFELHRTAFKEHIERIWGWDEKWQKANFARECASSLTSAVRLNGRAVGYLQVRHEPHRVFLQNIALHPEFQSKGIGTALLDVVKAEATARQVPLELAVFRTNASAQRFYERHGFVRTGDSTTHIEMTWRYA